VIILQVVAIDEDRHAVTGRQARPSDKHNTVPGEYKDSPTLVTGKRAAAVVLMVLLRVISSAALNLM